MPRILFLPAAAAAITALCVYKTTRTYPDSGPVAAGDVRRPAPLFELFDQKRPSEMVRLSSYLGRHRILVVFFDGTAGADRDPWLRRLRDEADRVRATGAQVFAISEALPQDNRRIEEQSGRFPFPLLSDPGFAVHRAWGRYDDHARRTLPGVFVIDRAGRVAWDGRFPKPSDPSAAIGQLLHEG